MRHMRRRLLAACVAGVLAGAVTAGPGVSAQLPPVGEGPAPTTTTTAPPGAEQPPAPAAEQEEAPPPPPPPPGRQAPPGTPGDGGDGVPAPSGGIRVPPEAQRIIDSVQRTPPSNNRALLDALSPLEEFGLSREEAMRVGLGRFPIAGPASYIHDWLFPRWGPGFRFHLGTDVFAAYGTPIRSPVDGVATTSNNRLGGLVVRVHLEDGTYFYLAHLSGLAPGFTNGMAVETGDIVGFVGDSGNARGGRPHLHIGIYPRGGPAIDPKPVLDRFLAEAKARLPSVIEAYRRALGSPPPLAAEPAQAASPALTVPTPDAQLPPWPAPLSALDGPLGASVLYVAGANPSGGALSLLEAEIADLARAIDWSARARPRGG